MTGAQMHNYKVYYLTSNTSLSNSTEAFMSRDAEVGDMELMESQKGLNAGKIERLRIRTFLKLNKVECDYMAYMCLLILHHENASYEEQNPDDNVICINVSTVKVCNPGIYIIYSQSYSFQLPIRHVTCACISDLYFIAIENLFFKYY